jgi:HK97 family phage portal protein
MIGRLIKALTAMRHAGRAPFLLGLLARTRFDYAKEVGDGIDSSVVTAPLQWVQRAFPEARLTVVRRSADASDEVEGHPLPALVAAPNPFYGGGHLWSATLFSYLVAGNAYWLKVRNGAGAVVELWWAPHWTIAPKWPQDGSEFISHYEYTPGAGKRIRLEPADVVHFRAGIDPRNPRLGLSPLHGAIREIFMDLEASNFVASLLRNMGVPGVVLSPEGGAQAAPEDLEATKAWFREAFGGDRRGSPLVMGAATKVQQYGFNPQQLNLSAARNVAEERVCACLGIPAAVVGFGAGLQTAKVGATMSELRRLAWTNGVLPVTRAFADELDRSLLPDFSPRDDERAEFDTSAVPALFEEAEKRATVWDTMIRGGWAEVAEAREAMGLAVDDSHRIFLRPFAVIEVPAGAPPRPLPAPAEAGISAHGTKQQRARPSRAREAYVRALERMLGPLANALSPRLETVFAELGAAAGDAALPLLEDEPPAPGFNPGVTRGKQSGEDEVLAGRIIEQLELPLHQAAFRRVYEAHYLTVAEEVSKAGSLIGLATDLPDPVARAVVAAGGRRSGLVDLAGQSRRALFDALAEGRAAGEGAEQLAARIRDQVSAGPWGSAETRARVIARTETKFAQNTSTVARAGHEGIDRFVVFDGRLGPERSDPEHIARDGTIVTGDEAAAMTAAEHPNGTLSFSPYFGEE